MSKPEVIYVGDPMCSWCWGIAPAMHQIADRGDVELTVIVGGLRPGPNAQLLDDQLRQELGHHWDKVASVSGQPFDKSALGRSSWVYDTELPAIAVTTMRRLSPAATLGFFTHLQKSFYEDGVDITDIAQYPGLIAGFEIDPVQFMAELESDEAKNLAWQEFAAARELGVAGFPTVLLRIDDKIQVLTRGYASPEHFDNLLAHWVEGRQPDSASIGTCSVEGIC